MAETPVLLAGRERSSDRAKRAFHFCVLAKTPNQSACVGFYLGNDVAGKPANAGRRGAIQHQRHLHAERTHPWSRGWCRCRLRHCDDKGLPRLLQIIPMNGQIVGRRTPVSINSGNGCRVGFMNFSAIDGTTSLSLAGLFADELAPTRGLLGVLRRSRQSGRSLPRGAA
jgi:hypothetical protein